MNGAPSWGEFKQSYMESSFGTRGRKAGYFFRSQWQIKTAASFIEERKAKR